MWTRRLRPGGVIGALVSSALAIACAATPTAIPVAARSPGAQSPKEVLPADLDVVAWLDVARLRDLWTEQPNRQIATILGEYGVLTGIPNGDDARFWLSLLAQSDHFWLGCRPTTDGCLDAVVFARGRFDSHDPATELSDLARPVDLGAGWFRYDRRTRIERHKVARIYFAPPDRIVVVSPTEIDAVERSLEQGHGEPALLAEERGLFSLTLRARSIARLVEHRAPAAARFLRDASRIKLWLEANSSVLELSVIISFANPERAERARLVFSDIAPKLGIFDAHQPSRGLPSEVVGNDLVLRLMVNAERVPIAPDRPRSKASDTEPAAQ
jgi:hypothetical protein